MWLLENLKYMQVTFLLDRTGPEQWAWAPGGHISLASLPPGEKNDRKRLSRAPSRMVLLRGNQS